jgi:hypothetical protein
MNIAGERVLIISSDGHAMPRMRQYRPYLPARLHKRFDEFCDFYDQHGVPPQAGRFPRGDAHKPLVA